MNIDLLRQLLDSLHEDIDDTLTWNALADWGEDNGQWAAGKRDTPYLKARLLKEACKIAAPTADGRELIGWVEFHWEYAEPGYSSKNGLIATGRWNDISHDEGVFPNHKRIVDDAYPSILCILLNDLGVDIEWADEWSCCSECGRLVRTSPTDWHWTPSYEVGDGELLCLDCAPQANPEQIEHMADELGEGD